MSLPGQDSANDFKPASEAPNPADIRRCLSKILRSSGFSSSERLSAFLRTAVERTLDGERDRLKESVLGIDVFGREPGYDPKIDPIVRVQAHRLRSKLADYYEKEGYGDAVRIELPKGAYVPAFHRMATTEAGPSVEQHRMANRGLVVLPFVSLSRDDDNEFFSDGLTDELINALTQVRGLRVVARTSSFAFKGKQQDVREIGRSLGVEAVLEGGIRRDGAKLRVTVQLVSAADGCQLWGRRYDRRIDDVFAIQEDIACSIAEALKIELSRIPSTPLKTHTLNQDAHNLYLKGRYWYHRWTVTSSPKAIGFFQEALQREPTYAPAYAGLADCYFLLGLFGPEPPSAVMPRAKAAAMRALEIDETLAEAHCALGLLAHSYDWDTGRCREELERAISLNPGYALAHSKYGVTYLVITGKLGQAVDEIARGVNLDPLSPQVNVDLAYGYLFRGMYSDAAQQAQKTLDLDPSYVRAYVAAAMSYGAHDQWGKGIEAIEKGLEMAPQSPQLLGLLGWLLGCNGNADGARSCERQLNDLSKTRHVSALFFALIHMGLNEKSAFFDAMNAACNERAPYLRYVNRAPVFKRFAADERFQRLVKRLRLDDG